MSNLQFILSKLTDDPKRDDEFTIHDVINEAESQGKLITQDQATKRMNRIVESGELKKRKIRINGTMQNVYSVA